jgi:hypothetical protein
MWDDRIDMMALVQECLFSKAPSKMGLITDTLIAKGYHRCDKDERKKMDSVDRKADELATMRLRSKVLHEVWDHFVEAANKERHDSPERLHYLDAAMQVNAVAAEYAALRVRTEAKYRVSE